MISVDEALFSVIDGWKWKSYIYSWFCYETIDVLNDEEIVSTSYLTDVLLRLISIRILTKFQVFSFLGSYCRFLAKPEFKSASETSTGFKNILFWFLTSILELCSIYWTASLLSFPNGLVLSTSLRRPR